MITIIVAIAENGAIGAENQLLCRLPNDLKRFKRLTSGHTVIMGRKTFESLPNGALPNRTNVVITRNSQASFEGCEVFDNLQAAINNHQHENEIFIAGGATIYEQTIDIADKLYLTRIHHTFNHADTFFPEINENEWTVAENEAHPADSKHPYPYSFKELRRKI